MNLFSGSGVAAIAMVCPGLHFPSRLSSKEWRAIAHKSIGGYAKQSLLTQASFKAG